MRIMSVVLVLLLGLGSTPAAAQKAVGPTALKPRLVISETAIMSAAAPAPVRVRQTDSLKNGSIIGAVIGGVAMGGFVGFLCHALHEEGNPSCIPGTLLWTGLGAGAGAAAGAGIDALMMQRASVMPPKLQFKVRF